MTPTRRDTDFTDHVVDLLQGIGPVYSRRMFGAHGLFLDGLMFGLIADKALYLKADEHSEAEFTARGLEPFTYLKQGRPARLRYYQAPEEALEDGEVMRDWGNRAFAVALRAAADKAARRGRD